MTNEPRPRIDAVMCSWRIYGISDDYLSQRANGIGDWESVLEDSPAHGDRATFRLGSLPPDFWDSARYARASLFVAFDSSEWRQADDRLAARDRAIRDRASKVDLSDLTDGLNTWLSIDSPTGRAYRANRHGVSLG